ncbi:MAG: hypothetical protein WDO70_05815 [Alphaproteobacteria bacterium]
MAQINDGMPTFTLQPGEDLSGALDYLVGARRYVSLYPAPADYQQAPHSGDLKPVHGDPHRPAILDASYRQTPKGEPKHLLSISVPSFVPREWPFSEDASKPGLGPGFHTFGLMQSMHIVLASEGISVQSSKAGNTGSTHYVEWDVSPEDYRKGRAIISSYVHGDFKTGRELLAAMKQPGASEIVPALPAPQRPGADSNEKTLRLGTPDCAIS